MFVLEPGDAWLRVTMMWVLEPRDAWLRVTSDVGSGAKGCLVEGYK
jgi:hypothetical protein